MHTVNSAIRVARTLASNGLSPGALNRRGARRGGGIGLRGMGANGGVDAWQSAPLASC
jgi:hypothetical protein